MFLRNTTFTLQSLPKRFIDATQDPDPYQDAESEKQKAIIQ